MTESDGTTVRVRISPGERSEINARNRALLEEDLREHRLAFRSRPFEAHVQFSNFCNMSCIMCYAGEKPPLMRLAPVALGRLRDEVAPQLAVLTPYNGSEPLALTWDTTWRLAHEMSLALSITTNVELLDERKFHQMKQHVDCLTLSIDSHVPEVLRTIRPGCHPERIYANARRVAQLCREHDVPCQVNVVFMTENAPLLPDTLGFLAGIGLDRVVVFPLADVNGRCGIHDPLAQFSADYVAWIRSRCIEVAERSPLLLFWNVSGAETYGRQEPPGPEPARGLLDHEWREELALRYPGCCEYSLGRMRLDADGDVAPCGYATYGELSLGNLVTQEFEAIWNGANARDLRRGMRTGDVPSLCRACFRRELSAPREWLPFLDAIADAGPLLLDRVEVGLEVVEPAHMVRHAGAPRVRVRARGGRWSSYLLALAEGGRAEQLEVHPLERLAETDEEVELRLAAAAWERLSPNTGYWWSILGLRNGNGRVADRSGPLRCLIRHEDVERVPGSTLGYLDRGHLPVSDLGAGRSPGWQRREERRDTPRLQDRQRLLELGSIEAIEAIPAAWRRRLGRLLRWPRRRGGSER